MSKILIIEDEEAIADLEKDYLEVSGFEVEIEHRGDVGLKRSLTEDFNLVILDLVLLAAVWIYHMIWNLGIAAVIGIAGEAALAITYVVKSTLFEGSIQKFLSVFDITSHFDNFTNGILDLQGVVYFLSVIIIFLVLTVQTITKRRWN